MGAFEQPDTTFGRELLDELVSVFPNSTLTHQRVIPARTARYAEWPDWVSPALRTALEDQGVTRLFSHQAEAAEAIHSKQNTVIATGTSSGKSLGYQLPVLSRFRHRPHSMRTVSDPNKGAGVRSAVIDPTFTSCSGGGLAVFIDNHPSAV